MGRKRIIVACVLFLAARVNAELPTDKEAHSPNFEQQTSPKDEPTRFRHEIRAGFGNQFPPININNSPYGSAWGAGMAYLFDLGTFQGIPDGFYAAVAGSIFMGPGDGIEFGSYTLAIPAMLAGYRRSVFRYENWNFTVGIESGYAHYFSSFERKVNLTGQYETFTAKRPLIPASVILGADFSEPYTFAISFDHYLALESKPVFIMGLRVHAGYRF